MTFFIDGMDAPWKKRFRADWCFVPPENSVGIIVAGLTPTGASRNIDGCVRVSGCDERRAASFCFLRTWFLERAARAAENVAYRQRLATYQFEKKRPRLHTVDRMFEVWLSQRWSASRTALVTVPPATVVAWHRQGFRLDWRWKFAAAVSRVGRGLTARCKPSSAANRGRTRRGAPRVPSDLRLVGYDLAESTVASYIDRRHKSPSCKWKTFFVKHPPNLAAVDVFVVPTATFRPLSFFLVVRLKRRPIVPFNVTAHPSPLWTAQQIIEAFPCDSARRFLPRDRDGTDRNELQWRMRNLGPVEVVRAPRGPWNAPNCCARCYESTGWVEVDSSWVRVCCWSVG